MTSTSIEDTLAGARIALTGARKAQETADFVTRLGGVPIVAPSLSTTEIDPDSVSNATIDAVTTDTAERVAIDRIVNEDVVLFVFLTGVGARTLFRLAEAEGTMDRLRTTLGHAKVVVRGPKALGALKGAGFRVDWMPPSATVEAIIAGLDRFEVDGGTAVVQLSGFSDDRLRHVLEARGASVVELNLYRHEAPANEVPILELIDRIRAGTVDFLTFTSAIGVREFFGVLERHERDDEVRTALRDGKVVSVAVGPVTAVALADVGASASIVPETHTTGGMLRAIGEWIAAHPR